MLLYSLGKFIWYCNLLYYQRRCKGICK